MITDDCELHYHLDEASVNVLAVKLGRFTILVWKLTVNDEMVGLHKRLHWSERDVINFLWISAIFAVVMYFLYLCKQVNELGEL